MKQITPILLFVLSCCFISCTDRSDKVVAPVDTTVERLLKNYALQEPYVATERIMLDDDEQTPFDISDLHRTPLRYKIVRRMKLESRSVTVTERNDSIMSAFIRRNTTGELSIITSSENGWSRRDTVIKKPLHENFSRTLLFMKKSDLKERDAFVTRGTISNLAPQPDGISGSFNLVSGGLTVKITYDGKTEFDHGNSGSLRNGQYIEAELESGDFLKGLNAAHGWFATQIEQGDGKDSSGNDRWKKAAISLLEGGTQQKKARITALNVFFSDSNLVTVNSPSEFFLYFKKYRPKLPHCAVENILRIEAVVESALPDTEIVLLRHGNVAHGAVSQKRQLTISSERIIDGKYVRTFSVMMPVYEERGQYHLFVEMWTRESIYDNSAPVSTHIWGIPYRVQ